MNIGVLALQGAVSEHQQILASLGVEGRQVRSAEDLYDLDGLIIPGGESTTLEKLVKRFEIDQTLALGLDRGMAVWGTCAGMILLAQQITNGMPGQTGLGHLPIEVERNAFGRQLESCEVELEVEALGPPSFPAVFIRAPIARKLLTGEVQPLATFQGTLVALRYRRILATSFHPELTGDTRWHSYFLGMLQRAKPSLVVEV